ncbi:MAG: ParB/RepB/Spo0J family partition protein [Parvibaculales bacterium]
MAERKRGLGRGLSALIGETTKKALDEAAPVAAPSTAAAASPQATSGVGNQGFQLLGIDQLVPGKFQPRRYFDEDELRALATSLEKSGVLQPLLVRPLSATDGAKGAAQFEIIAGERRWRAAQLAKLHTVPVIVQALSDSVALEVGIIENVQRADLNPIEEAEGYQRLIEEFSYTQAELAETIGKSRSHIANILRLTSATPKVRDGLIMGTLSMGHARALLGHPQADQLVKKIIADGLSVRAVEALVAQTKSDHGKTDKVTRSSRTATKTADTRALEKTLADRLGLNVSLDDKGDGSGGQLHIEYKSLEQLDALIAHLLARHD